MINPLMKILQLITFFTIGSAAWILSSCCSKDQNCAEGNLSLGAFPYQYNQQIVFADTSGKRIRVQLKEGFVGTPQYRIDGSCSMPRKDGTCSSSIRLDQSVVIDSNNVLDPKYRYFTCSIQKSQDRPSDYSFGAFGLPPVSIWNYGNANNVYYGEKVPVYTTPYKTYNDVYTNIPATKSYMPGYGSRIVFTQNGILISFTLSKDTTHTFYLVE
jgi:hypothetical protein